jgi:predicted regulator of Ras-like GTPase activity (Roadblock/LC7/MglB family)
VDLALLSSHDGVPIAFASNRPQTAPGREEGLAALAASWLNELTQAVAPLTWNAPERVCLRAARGTLVLRRSESACLIVLLAREASQEDVRLSLDGTLARIERARLGRRNGVAGDGPVEAARDARAAPLADVPPAFPSRPAPTPAEEDFRPTPHLPPVS